MEDQTGMKLASSLQTLLKGEVSLTAALLQLIKALEAARGNGTSMISLIMPPKDQVWQAIVLAVVGCTTQPHLEDTGGMYRWPGCRRCLEMSLAQLPTSRTVSTGSQCWELSPQPSNGSNCIIRQAPLYQTRFAMLQAAGSLVLAPQQTLGAGSTKRLGGVYWHSPHRRWQGAQAQYRL